MIYWVEIRYKSLDFLLLRILTQYRKRRYVILSSTMSGIVVVYLPGINKKWKYTHLATLISACVLWTGCAYT